MAKSKLMLRTVSRKTTHRSNSSTTAGTLLPSIGGVAKGVGGILSLAEEKIPKREDELCANDKLAKLKNDWFRLLERPGTPKPAESLRDAEGETTAGESGCEEGVDGGGGCLAKFAGYDGVG